MMKTSRQTSLLTPHQIACIEDVILGLTFLKSELSNANLPELADVIKQCKEQIISLPLNFNNLHTESSAINDADMQLAFEMLEKYAAIKDDAVRKELIQSIELMDADMLPRLN
jgi:hypothetical protein